MLISELPEKPEIVRVWRDALWYNKNQQRVEGMNFYPGPPQANVVQNPPNRITTYDAKQLIDYVAEHGKEERPGKIWFSGMDVKPLYQISAEFWGEKELGLPLRLTGLSRLNVLKIHLYRWDILGSYSGQGHIGTISLQNTRAGKKFMEIKDLHEAGLAQSALRLVPIKIEMPDAKANSVKLEAPEGVAKLTEQEIERTLDETVYQRWVDDYRIKLSRRQIIEPLIGSLGVALGVVK